MSLIFQRSLPTPLSSRKKKTPSYTSDKHTIWMLPFIQSSHPSRCCRTNQLFLTSSDGRPFGPVELAFTGGDARRRDLSARVTRTDAEWITIISIIFARNINKTIHGGLLNPSSSCCRPSRAGSPAASLATTRILPALPLCLPALPPPSPFSSGSPRRQRIQASAARRVDRLASPSLWNYYE